MKHFIYIFSIFLSFISLNEALAQGTDCAGADPFCATVGSGPVTFPNSTGTSAQSGINYGCLGSQPNPSWYYMQINQSGNIVIDINQVDGNGSAIDVDYAVWGPFTSATGSCGSMGAPIDCSYSSSASEQANINGAVSGEYYLFLLTNFNGSSGTITFGLNGSSTGDTDCTVLNPSCVMNSMTATMTSCSNTPTLTFDAGGTITYTDPPGSGDLVVEDCYGFQYVVASAPFGTSTNYSITGLPQDGLDCTLTAFFTSETGCTISADVTSPPPITYFSYSQGICDPNTNTYTLDGTIEFSNPPSTGTIEIVVTTGGNTYSTSISPAFSSPESWTINGIPADGANYTVDYYFSGFPTCGNQLTGTSPGSCDCTADAGTFTGSVTGDGQNNYVLCFGDQIDISTNNDYTPPGDENIGGITYDPGIAYLAYTCPPTVFPPNELWDSNGNPIDPCLLGVVSFGDTWTDVNTFGDVPFAGTFTDQTIYYVPITTYSNVDGYYAIAINGGDWCYDMGTAFAVQYLPEITFTEVEDCNAGTATITVSGGLPELDGSNYVASNVSPATATLDNTTATHGGTITISGLQDGDMYSFDIVDDNGCPQTYSGGPFVGSPTADAGTDDDVCALTYNLAATPSFGTGTWTGPAGATFGNANSPTSSVTVTTAGSYTFTWTEDNGGGCTDSDDVTIQFSDVQYTQVVNNPTCGNADGDITLSASDGIPTYTYSIDNGSTTQGTGSFTGLSATTYNIVVEDALGCQATGTITLTDLGGPTIDAINSNDISCNAACDGDISISATGATQFSIDNGGTFSGTNTFNSLCAGTYDVIVEDALGCSATGSVTLTEPPALTHSTTQVDLLCASDCDGEIQITENGGSSPYQYSIDNGATNQGTGLFQNLCVGTYDILVTDAGGCTTTSQVTLTEPTPLSVTIGITDASCFGMCDGMMNSIPAGGTGPGTYSYSWSPSSIGGNVPLVTNLCAGSYGLTITDGNGCTLDTTGIVVGAPQAVTIDNVTTVDETCGGDCDGSLTINATGATEFSLDGITFGASNTFSNLCAGTYTVYAQDVNGCSADDQANVVGPSPVQVVANGSTTICIGQSTALTSVASGGVGNYTYAWDNGGTTQNINVTPAGSQAYCVVATDANGCSSPSSCVNVNLNPPLSVVALSDQSICNGDVAQINAIGSGGNGGPYTYTWDQGVGTGQNQSVSPSFTTVYTVSVSDGCTTPDATASVTITVNTIPNISFNADNLDGCAPVSVNFTETNVPAGSSCLWTFGDGGASTDCSNVSYSFENPGCWDVTLEITTPEGCQSSSTIADYICVYDYPNPDFMFGPQPTTILEPSINFLNTTTGASTYTWTFDTQGTQDQSTATNPSYSFGDVGAFEVCLDAVSAEGCPAQACDTIYIMEEFIVYVPNAFTPDDDGINDVFAPIISGVIPDTYEFLVFNRWGELIYQSQIVGQGWDGYYKNMLSQEDVYVWKLKVDDQVGETHEYIGHVTLIK